MHALGETGRVAVVVILKPKKEVQKHFRELDTFVTTVGDIVARKGLLFAAATALPIRKDEMREVLPAFNFVYVTI